MGVARTKFLTVAENSAVILRPGTIVTILNDEGTPTGATYIHDGVTAGGGATGAVGGSGDVTGPASATAGNLATLNATGKILADSGESAASLLTPGRGYGPASGTTEFGWLGLRGLVNSARAARTGEYVYLLLFGDSWMDGSSGINEPTWATVLEEKIRNTFGNAWAGYGYTNAGRYNNVTYQRGVIVSANGAWTTVTSVGPARGASPVHLSSATAGRNLVWTYPAGTPVPTRMCLVYNQVSGGGSFKWRFNTEAWSADVSTNGGSAAQNVVITTGLPTTDGFTFEIEVVSGTVGIAGLDHRCRAQGFVAHNLGVTGMTAALWNTWITGGYGYNSWTSGILGGGTRKGVCALMSLGANDMATATTAQFLASMQAMIDSWQTLGANVLSDTQWGVVMQCENDRTGTLRPTEYYPVINGTLDNGDVGSWAGLKAACFDANVWFGNMDKAGAQKYMNTAGGYHLNRRGAGVFAAGVCDLLGI
jgi:hypothetical protein